MLSSEHILHVAATMVRSSVKALVRGLDVLATINDHAPVTIARLVEETGYPKATVIRLLQTLCIDGYVEESGDGLAYQVSPKATSLSRAVSSRHKFSLAADQVLKDLGTRLKWPSEMLIMDGHSLTIEAGNRDTAPINLQIFERRRFPLLDSASGIALLSAMDKQAAFKLVKDIATADKLEDFTKTDIKALCKKTMASIAEATATGYALKKYNVVSPGMRVVAVPLFIGAVPSGGLSLVHYEEYVDTQLLEKILVPALISAASAINDNLVSQASP